MSVAETELQRLGGLSSVVQLLISSTTSTAVRCDELRVFVCGWVGGNVEMWKFGNAKLHIPI